MNIIVAGILLNIVFAVFNQADAATFTVKKYNNSNEYYIHMVGGVEPGDHERLWKAYLDARIKAEAQLILDSPGGDAQAMEKVIKVVRDLGLRTRVSDNDNCYSACANIWLAGKDRELSGNWTIGFHVSSYAAEDIPLIMNEIGPAGLQAQIQNDFSSDLDAYIYDGYKLARPYEFTFNVASYGYNASQFFRPTAAQVRRLIGNVDIW